MTDQSIPLIKPYVALIKVGSFDNSLEFAEKLSEDVISDLSLKVVKKMSHIFSTTGITLGYILSQSHLVVHTYPENGIIHVDLAMCSDRSEKEFKDSLKHALSDHITHSIEVKSIDFDRFCR